MALIIVESPTKARTFNRILKSQNKGDDYYVFATMGHIRDLPANKVAIDYTNNFEPDYQIIKNKEKVVTQLKELAKKNKEIILATDLDREGESISYHAAFLLGLIKEKWPVFELKDKTVKRIVFHEITPHALNEALENPGELRADLVKAQQGRRILDRIVGYELSPLLWKKLGKNWLSAGRVQTVALRIIVEREKEITAFKTEPYFQIYGNFDQEVRAKLIKKDGVPYEIKTTLKLFDGDYTFTKTSIDKEKAVVIEQDLKADAFTISDVLEDIVKKYPPPPFTTSLLQQEGFQRFGFSSKQTMRLAQDLYERGIITYHRTDSFSLSTQFVFKAKDYIEKTYGKEYALEKPRGFKTKSRSAQEAHEAIRPTRLDKDVNELIEDKKLTQNHRKLYQLIFDRALATQMKEAEVKQIKVFITSNKKYLLEADYQQVMFDGFLKVLNPDYVEKNKQGKQLSKNSVLNLLSTEAQESATKPPPRYNEASLIKTLEEKGIGRPSTYAPIISLIQDKYYVEKESRYFKPTHLGTAISQYLSTAFPNVFDLGFTAQMEDNLDKIANKELDMVTLLSDFYSPFKKNLDEKKADTSVIDVQEDITEKCPQCGGNLTVRFSKYGKFLACSNYPKCKFVKPFLNVVKGIVCPKDGGQVVVRFSKTKKKFYGCANYPKCDFSAWTLFQLNKEAKKINDVVK